MKTGSARTPSTFGSVPILGIFEKYSGVQTDDLKRLRELERENSQVKRIVAEMALEIDTVKVVIRKNGMALPSDARERTS